jgi:hypothetical protein
MDYQWGADTAVMRSYMDDNSGYGFILLVIDFFSTSDFSTRPKDEFSFFSNSMI